MPRSRNLIALALVLLAATTFVVLVPAPASAAYSGTPVPSWSPTNGRVYAIARANQMVIIGGSFTAVRSPNDSQTVTRRGLAAFDADTGALLPWNPGATGGDIRALETSGDGTILYVGGYFTTLAGSSRYALSAVSTATGALVGGFNTTLNSGVHSIARSGSTLFIGGTFTTFGGASHPRLAAVSATTGAPINTWTGSASAAVNTVSLTADGTGVLVGGQFRTLSGQSRDYIGMVSTGNGAATSWRPPAPCLDSTNPCFVFDIDADATTVYAAIGGPGGRASAYDVVSGARRWNANTDGDVQAIAVDGNTVYAGGHFDTTFAGAPRAGLVALSTTTGGVSSGFDPRLLGGTGVWDILADPEGLRVGGGFTSLDATGELRYTTFPQVADPVDSQPPTTPTGLRATNVSDTFVALSWNASTDNNVVAGYRVFRDGAQVASVGGTNWTDTNLSPTTSYRYAVQAVDGAGNYSTMSAPLDLTTEPPSNSLVKDGSVWRYLSNGSNQGTAWRAPTFVDTSWATGAAQLGYGDDDEITVISPLGLTHYFRQSFQVANRAAVTALQLRLLRDDGAIVYINGTEVVRSNMPTGAVTYQTAASTSMSGSAESTFYNFSVPTSSLVAGTNVIAVEVHNAAVTSSDVSFDLELVPTYGSTGDTTPPTTPTDLRSTALASTSVSLAWNASTDAGGVAGYRVSRDGVVAANVTGLTWTDSGRSPGSTHVYRVRAIDQAGNLSAESTALSVTFPGQSTALVQPGATWRYLDNGSFPGAAWTSTGFDDSAWRSGPAELGFGDGDEATLMTRGVITYWLRHSFSVPDPSGVASLTVNLRRDDGAVVYLNGTEVVRSNMPATSTPTTFADTIVDGARESTWYTYTIPASALVAGVNTIAAEVHQANTSSSDITFDLSVLTG